MLISSSNSSTVATFRETQSSVSSARSVGDAQGRKGLPGDIVSEEVASEVVELVSFSQSFPPVLPADQVSLSPTSQSLPQEQVFAGVGARLENNGVEESESPRLDGRSAADEPSSESTQSASVYELTPEQQVQVDKLALRDAEVKAHERAHKAVGGQYAGSISYQYQVGPDGKRYAVGGEVPIDVAPVQGDPQATIEKMTIVKAAALAPAEPSAQDQRVAAAASQAISSARVELATENRERLSDDSNAADLTASRVTKQDGNAQGGESFTSLQGLNTYQSVSRDNESALSARSSLIDSQV